MESSSQDRNLPATERKLQQARDDGQVARSSDLGHLAVLGTGIAGLLTLIPSVIHKIKDSFAAQLTFNAKSLEKPADVLIKAHDMGFVGLQTALMFATMVIGASLITAVMSGGWVLSAKPIMPDFSRINPLSGLGRLFSKEKLTEVAKMLAITTVVIAVSSSYLLGHWPEFLALARQPSPASLLKVGDLIANVLMLMLLVIGAVAVIDVPLQYFMFKLRMRMSHEEIKQEHKESEGNPQMKGRRRAKARELAQRNSINAVPTADFVVMNPTHYAVALKYDDSKMNAPQVVAKGADLLAFRIKELAGNHAIPVLQSPMLARALYAHAEINQEIPSALYTAVAQVLAYVYRLKAAMRGEAPMPGDLPQPEVPQELDPHYKKPSSERE